MKINVGNSDKVIRYLIAIAIIIAAVYYKSWWGLLAIVPLATAISGKCPLYSACRISTSKKQQ